ncbi:MAG: hypothetical protein M1834_003470 [Cirrosporium novae-zelandiae]|nr:MAG: hypothetical protein M1834_003470 [Cirrosporium novae-zelandiae]
MQRAPYAPAPAQSPPLHHPVPQHVSTVPMMRSPPPPSTQPQSAGYGNPYQPQPAQGGGNFGPPNFGGFMNDTTAQMGFQVGRSALAAGQEYMDKNVGKFLSVAKLKYYFNVSNSYVISKVTLVLFPWRHKPWSRLQSSVSSNSNAIFYLPPRDDLNAPDLYIPVMALVSYCLLQGLLAGIHGTFHPELFGTAAGWALMVILLEYAALWLGMFILTINNESTWLDLISYSGYKFVGCIVTIVIGEILSGGNGTSSWIGWIVFIYCFLANAFFLLRSLKYVLLPDSTNDARGSASYTIARSQRNKRTQFLFVYSYIIQFFFMWLLTRD